VFDRQWEPQAVARLSQIFATFTDGLLAWPFLDIPFTPFAAAVAARKELLQEFSNAVEEARAALAAGQPQRSVVGMLLVAEDEQGNRWVHHTAGAPQVL
jgi:cytochrome P450